MGIAPGETSTAVLDASVAVRWLVPEEGSEQAATLIERATAWIAPRLLVTEVAAALRRKVVAGDVRVEYAMQAMEILGQIVEDGILRFAKDEAIVNSALMLALATEHKLPDCLYLALAQREDAQLVTADHALARIAEKQGVSVHLLSPGTSS